MRSRVPHLFAASLLTGLALAGAPPAFAGNAVSAENAHPGDSSWTAALQDPVSGDPPIAGYADRTSARPGDTVTFHVTTTPAERYRIEIDRLGWYGGAGGRRISCLVGAELDPGCTQDRGGTEQPAPPAPDPVTGEVRAGWSATDALTVPADWPTGYYLAVFRLMSGPKAGTTGFTPFIVEPPPGDRSAILVQVPTNTWQAYNRWGGKSLYTVPGAPRASHVSFDRPFDHRLLFDWEYPLIRYLERSNRDVSYVTDDDVDADPHILLDHTLVMSAGHDEYWTKRMRDGWEDARARGVNLAFMGANASYWQVRYADDRRTMIAYKYSPDPEPDPALKTTQFRLLKPARPECQMIGEQFQGLVLIRRNIDAVADGSVGGDSWFVGSGLAPGAVISGIGGGETDAITPGCHVPPVTGLLHYSGHPLPDGTPTTGDAVRYTACSGAEVFAAGSLQFSWGLDPWRDPGYSGGDQPPVPPADARLQSAMDRILGDLTRRHTPAHGPPHVCVPRPRILSPASWVSVGQAVRLRADASDPYGHLAAEQWQLQIGRRVFRARGAQATVLLSRPGSERVSLTARDASGAHATVTRTLRAAQCSVHPPRRRLPWPLIAQTGRFGELWSVGTIRASGDHVVFSASAPVTSVSLVASRVTRGDSRAQLIPVLRVPNGPAATPIPVSLGSDPTLLEVVARTPRGRWHERFLLSAAPTQGMARAQSLDESLCDGTTGHVLDPVFGGPLRLPLRLAVSSGVPATVTVTDPRGDRIASRTVPGRRRSVLSIRSRSGIVPGIYEIVIAPHGSPLGQKVRLSGVAL